MDMRLTGASMPGETNGGAQVGRRYIPVSEGRQSVDDPLTGDPEIRSEGQRLMLQVAGSLAEIGRELGGTPRQVVHRWRVGGRIPTTAARARIEARFGIPARAWFVRPGGTLPPAGGTQPAAAPAAPAVVDQVPDEDTEQPLDLPSPQQLASTNHGNGQQTTLAYVRKLLADVQRDAAQTDLVPSERARLATVERGILALHFKVEESAQLAESRYVLAHPAWHRLRRAILTALEPHPLAAQAVLRAIESIEQGVQL